MLQVRHPRLYDTCSRTCAPVRQTRVVVLKSLLLGIHLLCVNVAAVGPLFCLALLYRRNAQAAPLARWITRQSCVALFVGMLLGGTIMGLYSFGGAALDGKRFYQALLTIPHDRLWWAAAELVFYYLCMLPVVRYWKPLAARRWPIALLCLLSATNLIYHFAPLFVIPLANALAGPYHFSVEKKEMYCHSPFKKSERMCPATIRSTTGARAQGRLR